MIKISFDYIVPLQLYLVNKAKSPNLEAVLLAIFTRT